MQVDLAREGDDAEILRILRENPVEGAIQVALEREPSSFLAGAVQGDLHQVVVARDESSGRLMGMGSRSVLVAYVNGRETRLGYLSQLRLDRGHRGRTRLIAAGYARLRDLHRADSTPFSITTIVQDNRPARRLLECGLKGLPTYRALEPILTLTLPLTRRRKARPSGVTLERGSARNLGEIAECLQRNGRRHQFAPRWTEDDLLSPARSRGLRPEDFRLARREGKVIGCLARWDQTGFKQTVVRGYEPGLGLLRPLLNLAAPWLRRPRLPPAGEQVRHAFVSHIAVDCDDPEVFLTLLADVYRDSIGGPFDYLILALARRHPLADAVKCVLPHREYVSILYLVHWEDSAAAAGELDGRVPHVEAAIL